MAGRSEKFTYELDFLTKFKADKSEIDKMANEVEEAVKSINPDIKLDTNELKKGIANIVTEFSKLENASNEVDKLLSQMDLNLDSESAQKAIKEIEDMLKDIDNIDMSKLEHALNGLGDIDLDSMANELQNALDTINSDSARKEIAKLANEYETVNKETAQMVAQQKSALAQMKLSGMEGSESYKVLENEIQNNINKLEELVNASKNANDVTSQIGESAGNTSSFMDVAMKFQAFGAIGESLSGFAEKGMEAKEAMRNLSAQTGLTGEKLENLRNISNEVFLAGVGESISESIKSIGVAQQQLGKFLDTQGIKDFTVAAGGISKVFGVEVNETLSKSRTFIANFGLEGKKAGELISYLYQTTGSEDALDTLDEYSQLMVKAGYNAEEFSGLLSTGISFGQRNMDKLGDSVKEMQIRLNAGDTSKAIGEINSKVSAQINAIVQSAESGQITVKDMANQTSKLLADAASKGDITTAIRDQYATALSGTMAEDMGGDMWTKIFSAKIDPSAVTAQAKAASEQITAAMEPQTFAAKLEKRLDILKTSFSETFGPVTAQLGGMMQSVAGVAPGLSVIGEQVGKFGGYIGSLGGVSGAMSVLSTSTLGAAKSFIAMGAAFLATPIGMIAVGLVGLIGAIKLVSSLMNKSAEDKLNEAKAEEEALVSQKKSLEVQKEKVKSNQELVKSYEELGNKTNRTTEEESRLNDIKIKLAGAYPGVISGTKSFAENLSALKGAAKSGQGELSNLNTKLSDLDKAMEEKKIIRIGYEADAAVENIENIMVDKLSEISWDKAVDGAKIGASIGGPLGGALVGSIAPFADKVTEFLGLGSLSRNAAKDFMKPFIDGMNNAKNSTELQTASTNFKMAIMERTDIDEATRSKMLEAVTNSDDKMMKKLEEQNKQIAKAMTSGLKNAFKDGNVSDEEISQIAQKYGKTTAEVRKLFDSVKTEANNAKIGEVVKSAMEIKGDITSNEKVDALVKNYKNAKTEIERSQIGDVLSKAAPGAIQASQMFVDSNGKLRTSYKLLDDKVKESTKTAKDRYSSDLQAKQDELIAMIQKEGGSYQSTKKKMEELTAEINKKKKLGLDTSDLEKQVGNLGDNLAASQKDILTMGSAAIKTGKDAKFVYAEIAKETGKSPVEVKKLIIEQQKSESLTKNQVNSVKSLADAWASATKATTDNVNQGISALSAMQLKRKDILKKNPKERTDEDTKYLESYNAEYVKTLKNTKENVRTEKEYARISENVLIQTGKTEVDRLAKAKELYERKAAHLELDKLSFDFNVKNQEIYEKRASDSLDELVIEKNNLGMIEAQKKTLIEVLKAKGLIRDITSDGKIIYNVGVKEADKNEIGKMLMDTNMKIAESQIKVSDLKVKLKADSRELEAKIKEIEVQKIEWEISLGIRKSGDYSDIIQFYKDQSQEIQKEIDKSNEDILKAKEAQNQKLIELNDKIKFFDATAFIKSYEKELQTSYNQNSKIQKFYSDMNEEIFAKGDKLSSKEINAIRNKYSQKIANEEKGAKDYSTILAKISKDLQTAGYNVPTADINAIVAKYDPLIKAAQNTYSQIVYLEQSKEADIKALGQKASKEQINEVKSKYATLISELQVNTLSTTDIIQSMNSELETLFASAPEATKKALEDRFKVTLDLMRGNGADLIKKKIENDQKEKTYEDKKYTDWIDEIEKFYTKKEEVITQKEDALLANSTKFLNNYKTARLKYLDSNKAAELSSQDEFGKKQLANLESLKQNELITEEEYNKQKEAIAEASNIRKAKIEEDYRRKQLKTEAYNNSLLKAATDVSEANKLEVKKDKLSEELEVLKVAKKEQGGILSESQQKQYEDLSKQLDDTNTLLETKGSLYGRTLSSVSENMQNAISYMFAGSGEMAADSVREMFASIFGVLAQALTKEAQAVVTKLVLDWLYKDVTEAALPLFAKLALIPMIQTVVGGAVNAIVQPTIDVMAFPTGGYFDSPQLIQVGDAARLGSGSNKEWLFNEPQLATLVKSIIVGSTSNLASEIKSLNDTMANQELTTKLKGPDIYLSQKRTNQRISARAR